MYDFVVYAMMMGAISSNDGSMPFWATSNDWGLTPENGSSMMYRTGASTSFDPSKTIQYRWGVGMQAASAGTTIILDEAYGSLRWKNLTLDLGIKHPDIYFMGNDSSLGSISVSGGRMAESGNARSMPGYRFTLDALSIPFTSDRLYLAGEYGDFYESDKAYVKGTLRHRMRINLGLRLTERMTFDAGVDHYAQWGGIHPVSGRSSSHISLENYLRMCVGAHGGEDATTSDQINVIGDQGGSEFFKLNYKADKWSFTVQHDIPYSDKSGMRFQNFPDGINTAYLSLADRTAWITDMTLEYIYTMDQSGELHDVPDTEENRKKYKYRHIDNGRLIIGGGDNYFNNGFYRQGWTNYGDMIGCPLMTTGENGIVNNRVKAISAGMSGMLFHKSPYKIMATWSDNYGLMGNKTENGKEQFSFGLTGNYPVEFNKLNGLFRLCYGLYFDKGEMLGDRQGLTIGIQYTI